MPSMGMGPPLAALLVAGWGGVRQDCAMSRTIRNIRSALLCLGLLAAPLPAPADEVSSLRAGLAAVASKDWPGALAEVPGAGPVGGDILRWHWLRAGEGRLGDYEDFLARRSDWPGLPLLKEKGEEAAARSTDPGRVIAYFGADAPQTGAGAVALVQALMQAGQPAKAEQAAFDAWVGLSFTPEEQAALLALQGPALSVAHEARLDNILWDGGRGDEARRMLPLVSADFRALAEARLALEEDRDGVNGLIAKVPPALQADAGLAYDRFVWRMRRDMYDTAAELIVDRSDSAQHLGRPEAWAERRALLARRMMRDGAPKTAYRIASTHDLTGGAAYADLEFLSGFIALRKLNDPDRALRHFDHLRAGVGTPISLSRADYWRGRALEAKGDKAGATAAYQAAAQYQTAYYGLLAAEKLGLSLDPALISVGQPGPGWRGSAFAGSSVLKAAWLLSDAGDRTLSKRFFLHLAEGLSGPELSQLADLTLRMDQPHIALLIAKAAAERGLILPRAYFPVPDMVPDDLAVSRALALAISRRESEFDPAAQSPAGARGLMQLLPETAARMAKGLGLEHTTARLTTDPAYNVAVGSAYLRQMLEEFGPSVALIASGYNAGPGRPRAWVQQFGDPRRPEVDVVDWVETIPFAETRTYVMRVVEGVVIYRQRLKGASGPIRITAELKGG